MVLKIIFAASYQKMVLKTAAGPVAQLDRASRLKIGRVIERVATKNRNNWTGSSVG